MQNYFALIPVGRRRVYTVYSVPLVYTVDTQYIL